MQLKNIFRAFTLLFCMVALLFFYHDVIFHLNNFNFAFDGDGLKNYFFVKYYINDFNALHNQFNGMNYPFGENLNYLDAQPLIAVIFKWINQHITNTGDAFVPTTYILFFVSIAGASLLLLEIFFEYGVFNWLAVLFACSITLLSPQIQRITFHIYLSYIFVIPAAWLLYLKFVKSRKVAFAILLNSLLIIVGFLHPYYTPLCITLIFLLVIFEKGLSITDKLKSIIAFAVVPILIFKLLLSIGYNGAEDFAQHPYGAFGEAYRSRPEDVFFPNVGSVWNQIFQLNWIAHSGYEGEAFLGWSLSLTGLCFMIYMLTKCIRNKSVEGFNPFVSDTNLFFASCIIFIFSAGALHFILPKLLQDSMPSFITQFRCYGRLAWINYYLLSVFFCFMFYKFILWMKNEKWKQIIAVLLFVMLCLADIIEMNLRVSKQFEFHIKSNADNSCLALLNNINDDSYQAIISLPYFHLISTLQGEREPQPNQMWPAFQLSLKTGLPLTDTYSSRSSQQHAKQQLAYYNNSDKKVLELYKNKKPLLILVTVNDRIKIMNKTIDKSALYPKEIDLLTKARLINKSGNLELYEIEFKDL